jgi:hypothetical protein
VKKNMEMGREIFYIVCDGCCIGLNSVQSKTTRKEVVISNWLEVDPRI